MSPTVLYVIGPPGVGKTSLVRSMLGMSTLLPAEPQLNRGPIRLHPNPKWTEAILPGLHLCAAGHYTGQPFDGGDTVPYTGAEDALRFWAHNLLKECELTILDGDRFSTQPSLDFLRDHRPLFADQVRILGIHLVASPETLAARRSQRGSNQNETWMKGRATKSRNFAQKIGALEMNAEKSTAELHLRVSKYLKEEL